MSTAFIASDVEIEPEAGAPNKAFPASAKAILLNYSATAALLLLGYAFYTWQPYYQEIFPPATFAALRFTVFAYLLLLPIYYVTFPDDYTTKSRAFWQALPRLFVGRCSPAQYLAVCGRSWSRLSSCH